MVLEEWREKIRRALLSGEVEQVMKFPHIGPRVIAEGANILHIAILLEYNDCVAELVANKDIDLSQPCKQLGWTPLIYSLYFSQSSSYVNTKLLLQSGRCNVNQTVGCNKRALHILSEKPGDDIFPVELLLDARVAINPQDDEGMTPFMTAVRANNINVAKLLMSRGCLINLSNVRGETPLHFAVQSHSVSLVSWLIEIKCNMDGVDDYFRTPLMKLLSHDVTESQITGMCRILKSLIKAGCYLNTQDPHGNTPLLIAMKQAACVKKQHVQQLLQAGADPDIFNRVGLTPLWQAVYDGPNYSDGLQIIQLLLEANCKLDIRSQGKLLFTVGMMQIYCYENHLSPFDLAMFTGYYSAARVLAFAGSAIKPDLRYERSAHAYPAQLRWLTFILKNPHCLQQLCRITIRKQFGPGLLPNRVDKLTLPAKLKNYILLKDLFEE